MMIIAQRGWFDWEIGKALRKTKQVTGSAWKSNTEVEKETISLVELYGPLLRAGCIYSCWSNYSKN
jgi:hypothetical protein